MKEQLIQDTPCAFGSARTAAGRGRLRRAFAPLMLALALLGAFSVTALAALDFSYSGELDPQTGVPLVSSGSGQSNRLHISGSTYYDRDTRMFVYPVGNGIAEVRSSIADGMIVTQPVSLRPSDGLTLTVYRNGEELIADSLDILEEAGQYIVSVRDGDTTRNLLQFTIIGARTNLSGGYTMPDGFYILDATLDGEETYFERSYIAMTDEGDYAIEYICPDADEQFTLETTVDHTPPELTLEGRVDKKGRFHSAVDVSGFEEGDSVLLQRDGETIVFPRDGHLPESGVYTLEAFDDAGNSVTYQFTILMYFDVSSLLFFALVLLSLVGVAGYVFYKRKNLKIV